MLCLAFSALWTGVWPVWACLRQKRLQAHSGRRSLPSLSLPASFPSGKHVLMFSVAIHILGVWILLVFIFGLISSFFSIYVSSKRFLENRSLKGLLCFLGCSENCSTFEVRHPLWTVNEWILTFSDIRHEEGAIAACCKHSSRCQIVVKVFVMCGFTSRLGPFPCKRVHQILKSPLFPQSSQGNK